MARVRRHRHGEALQRALGAGVVLHVAGPAEIDLERGAALHRILELGQDLHVRLRQHVGQHVEAAAVRHAEQHVRSAGGGGAVQDHVEDRDQQVQAFDREAGLAGEGAVQELLEGFDLAQAIEELDVVDRLDRRPEAARLSGVAQPVALLGHEDVRVVVAGGGAVDPPQRGDRLERVGRGGRDRPGDQAGRQARQHPVRHAVERSGERRITDRRGSQRIEGRRQVAVAADALGEVDRADDLGDVGAVDDAAGGGADRGIGYQAGVEFGPRRRVHRVRILAIPVVQLGHVGRVDTLEVVSLHGLVFSGARSQNCTAKSGRSGRRFSIPPVDELYL